MKSCTKCGLEQPLDNFYLYRRKDRPNAYYSSACNDCRKAQKRTPHARSLEAKRRRALWGSDAAFRQRNLDSQHKSKYGITRAEKDALLDAQGGVCAICGTDSPAGRGWHTDHDHADGAVRGILCTNCNVMLGMAKDNAAVLLRAVEYLSGAKALST